MGLLPQLNRTALILFFSVCAGAAEQASTCEGLLLHSSDSTIKRVLEDDGQFAREFIEKVERLLEYRDEFLTSHTLGLGLIDWNRVRRTGNEEPWAEFVVHFNGKPFQLKVYFQEYMYDRRNSRFDIQADIDQLIVQSALSEIGLARPVLGIVPPLLSDWLGRELHRYGLISLTEKDSIYFAVLFPYFDTYNSIVVPDFVDPPHWFDEIGRTVIKSKIIRFERALSRLGILHGPFGHFIVSANGEVQLADFDVLRETGFRPRQAGDFSSIFVNPADEVRMIFESSPSSAGFRQSHKPPH